MATSTALRQGIYTPDNRRYGLDLRVLQERNVLTLPAFLTVMRQGTTLVMHSAKGAEPVQVTLVGSELQWFSLGKPTGAAVASSSAAPPKAPNPVKQNEVPTVTSFTQTVGGFRKVNKVLLKDVQFLAWGKKSDILSKGAITKDADDNLFFSLVTRNETLDFEAASKEERDGLCEGLTHELSMCK